jgi:hypothetical protein
MRNLRTHIIDQHSPPRDTPGGKSRAICAPLRVEQVVHSEQCVATTNTDDECVGPPWASTEGLPLPMATTATATARRERDMRKRPGAGFSFNNNNQITGLCYEAADNNLYDRGLQGLGGLHSGRRPLVRFGQHTK